VSKPFYYQEGVREYHENHDYDLTAADTILKSKRYVSLFKHFMYFQDQLSSFRLIAAENFTITSH
jgi:hypothetical protein